jgi:hypothetical protein
MSNSVQSKRFYPRETATIGYIIFFSIIFTSLSHLVVKDIQSGKTAFSIFTSYWPLLILILYYITDWLSTEMLAYLMPEGKFSALQVLGGLFSVTWLSFIIVVGIENGHDYALKSFAFYSFVCWLWDIELCRKYIGVQHEKIPLVNLFFFVWMRGCFALMLVMYTIIHIHILQCPLWITVLLVLYVVNKIGRYIFLERVVVERNQ